MRECSEKCKGGTTSVEEEESEGEAERRGTTVSEDQGVGAGALVEAGAEMGENEYEREVRIAKSMENMNDGQV